MSCKHPVPSVQPLAPRFDDTTRTGAPLRFALALVAMAITTGCDPSDAPKAAKGKNAAAAEDVWFEEVAADNGVAFIHRSGHREVFYMPEDVTGGAALFDYDGDGDLDLYLVQGGDIEVTAGGQFANQLYQNDGSGAFTEVTAAAGVGDVGYGIGCACGDYDADGDTDLYVTNVGPNVLYRNNGDGTFTNVTAESGTGDPGFGASAAFMDYDADGDLDLCVSNYIVWSRDRELRCISAVTSEGLDYCSPNNYQAPARDVLYRNDGGRFTDVTQSAGLGAAFGNGLGVVSGDFDADGDLDIYIANDGTPNQIWMNQGDGTFADESLMRGCAVNQQGHSEAGMGLISIDIDHDGDLDLFMSHLANESNTCYVNNAGLFDDSTAILGLSAPSLDYTGFGLGFADFDHDGRLDLYVANGRVKMRRDRHDPNDPYAEPNLLFRGVADGRFEQVLPIGGTAELLIATSRGAAFGDIDNDGDIDIVVVNKDAPPYVLKNIVGNRGHWIMFRVLDSRGVVAVGSRVRIEAGNQTQWRRVDPAYSYCSSNDPRIHFGLGKTTTVQSATVRRPNGTEQSFGPFQAGKVYELRLQ